MTRRVAVALAAAGLLVAVGCAKDETVASTDTTTPVSASSGGGGAGTTEPDDSPGTTDPEDADKDKGKGGGSGEYAEACTAIEDLEALEDDDDTAAVFALMEQARDAGPDELVDHWDTMIDILGELDALDQDSDEALAKAFELLEDPEYLEAAAAIDDFAEEECGIDIDLDPSEEGETGGGLIPDDRGSDSTDPDSDPTSIKAVKAHIKSRFGTEAWYSLIDENVTWGSSGSGGEVTWTIGLGDPMAAAGATTSELNDVCEVLAAYLDTYESRDVEIEISGADDEILVRRAPGESCTVV
jgi:hypothetical protein